MQTKLSSQETILSVQADATTIHIGEDAWELLSQEKFLADWKALYDTCPWVTAFQSPAFVITWYQVYRQKHLPIVVKKLEGGKLTGLLTLSLLSSGGKKGAIIGAGHYEAEYQAWLTEDPTDAQFIRIALDLVLKKFPRLPIQLRFIPPGAPLQWTKENDWKSRCVLQEFNRPLMDMSDPDLSRKFRKTEFRNKYNRLKRLGKLEFERVTGKEQFESILDELMLQYDFRQGAMFNKNQFRDEPLKGDFLLALFDQNLLHVTVLKINGEIFASIVAITMGNWVCLGGINIHTPFQAKFYSPGFVHFILLAEQILKEGIAMFDLTPGGDFYKERMANRHDQVHIIVVTNDPIYRLKKQLRKAYDNFLLRAGKWPMGFDLKKRKKIYLLKARIRRAKKQGMLATVVNGLKNLVQPPKEQVYLLSAMPLTNGAEVTRKQNSLSDLLLFEPEGTWMTRWEFLADAMHRFEIGQRSFTLTEGDTLLACVWVSTANHDQLPLKPLQNASSGITLQGFYCHPLGEKRFKSFLAAVATMIWQECPGGLLEARTTSREKTFCRVLEAIGFQQRKT